MMNMEQKLNAVLRCLAADRAADREAARAQIRAMMAQPQSGKPDTESMVRALLLDVGIPDHLKGHRYLVYALCHAETDPRLCLNLSHRLYPMVARQYDATVAQVERAMRHAIEVAWDRCDWDVLGHYFGNTVSAQRGRPTNGEFIARMVNVLRRQQAAS